MRGYNAKWCVLGHSAQLIIDPTSDARGIRHAALKRTLVAPNLSGLDDSQ
jgi:hypothetical protein